MLKWLYPYEYAESVFTIDYRKLYSLYENKICTGEESAQCRDCLERRIENAGYKVVTAIGDWKG